METWAAQVPNLSSGTDPALLWLRLCLLGQASLAADASSTACVLEALGKPDRQDLTLREVGNTEPESSL